MAETSRPDPANGYVVSTDEWERMGSMFALDGVFGSPADTSIAYADATGRQVKVRAGKLATVRGTLWYADPATDQIIGSLPANTAGNPRIDRLVLRLDRSTRQVRLTTIQGTAAATPSIPALTQSGSFTSGQWDFPLMRWNVANGYTTIAAADTTNEAWYPLASGTILCNSTSRPQGLALLQGQKIYEYDTKLEYVWNGTKWIRSLQHLALATGFSVTANTGFFDTGFTFNGEAGATYAIDSWLHTVAPTGSDLSLQWVLPTGSSIEWSLEGPASTDAGTEPTTVYQGAITTAGPLTIGGMASNGVVGTLRGWISLTNSGTCKLQGAQLVASGTSFIRANSWMTVKQSA